MSDQFTPLPADLPEDWTPGQIVSPGGTEVGLTEQHGYNYLNKAVNDAQKGVNKIYAHIDSLVFRVPDQSGNLTYNGGILSPQWNGYDPEKLEIGGQTSGIDAGVYTVTFTPKSGYRWSDGGADARSAQWSISKAPGSLTISPVTLSLDAGKSSNIVVTREGDGNISAFSSDQRVASVSVSGNNVVVTGMAAGNAKIVISVDSSLNYDAPTSVECSVGVEVLIYGAMWDGSPTTKWTRTGAAANFSDPVPYVAGATEYGSPFDNIMPWAGMIKSERTGGTMVTIPKFYYKLTQNDSSVEVQITSYPAPGFSVSPMHMERGDGLGERSVAYVGRYHCGMDDWKSVTGVKPAADYTREGSRQKIHELGSNIWQGDFAMRFTLWLLYIVEFADWNSQKTIGRGCGNKSGAENTGYTDSMPYHTGTTQSDRDTYGLGTQYRNIEGLWDNVTDWVDGCYNDSNGFHIIKNPADFSDTAGGTVVAPPITMANSYPSALLVTAGGGFPLFFPTKFDGSEETYLCDTWSCSPSSPCLCAGGNFYTGKQYGLFGIFVNSRLYSGYSIGSRLQELPIPDPSYVTQDQLNSAIQSAIYDSWGESY